MAERASASSSSGQASQPKRPCLAPAGQVWSGSNRNLLLGSCSTEEDVQRVATPMFFKNGTVGSGLSSTSGSTSDICFSSPHSDSQHDRRSQCSAFISSTSTIRTSAPPVGFPCTEVQPTALTDIPKESKDGPWDANQLQGFLIYSENVPSQNCHVESGGGVMGCEDQSTRSDWQWDEPLISVDEALDPDWIKFLGDVHATDPSKCGKEPERTKSHSAEYCQSCTGNALKDIVQLIHSMEKWLHSMEKRMHSMENSIQKLTEIVELANINSPHLGRNNDLRNLRLQFQTKLSDTLFTGKKLRGDGGARISVALIDVNTRDVVTSGPESSIKLDVVVLEGDFNKDDEDNWAHEEFENYVVKEREQKGLLLTGDLQVTLKEGVGELGELIFTDNSSWNRSKRFRIGLKVALGYCGNTRIREAKTDAFRVKEHRGESSKKHDSPAVDDEIWRLKMIAKDGKYHQKLSEARIQNVGDFLMQLFTDPATLKEILGMGSKSANWDTLENHAKSCKTNWKLYWYYTDGTRKHGAVFNTDRQLIGLIKDRVCCATRQLSADDQEHGDTIVERAFDNWNDVMEFNGETFSCSMQKKSSSSFPSQTLQIENFTPVQCKLTPRISAALGGPEAPLSNVGFTAEGHVGAIALASLEQLQNTNSGNAMKLSVDDSVCLTALPPISTDPLNVLIPRGDNGIPTVGLPIQSHGNNFQYAMRSHMIHSSSQMDYTVNENAPPSEPPSTAKSKFQSGSILPPPEGNLVNGRFAATGFR